MSFSYTPDEQNRVQAAEALGYKLDPIGKGDLAVLCIFSIIYTIDLFAVIYLIWNWNYPPIKSKGPGFLVGSYIAIVLWFVGDIQVNGLVHMRHTAFIHCKAFGVWLRIILGVCMVSSLIALRSYSLFRIFRQNKPYKGLSIFLPFLIYSAVMLIYGIVVQVLPERKTIAYLELLDVCVYRNGFKASLFVFVWVTWVYVTFVNWQIRGIKSSFNEWHEMLFICVLVFSVLTFLTILNYVCPEYLFDLQLRLSATCITHIAANIVWWRLVGVPLFNCMFRREKYLRYWMKKLSDDGLQRQYEQPPKETADGSMLYWKSTLGSSTLQPSNGGADVTHRPCSPFSSCIFAGDTREVQTIDLNAPISPLSATTLYHSSHRTSIPADTNSRCMTAIRNAKAALDIEVRQRHASFSQSQIYTSMGNDPAAVSNYSQLPLVSPNGYSEQAFYMNSRWAQESDEASLDSQHGGRKLI